MEQAVNAADVNPGAAEAGAGSSAVPELPQDAQRCIALTALRAEGSRLEAWTRLSLVARSWRDWLEDSELDVHFSAPMTSQQRKWLRATRRLLRSIRFHPDDPASCDLLHDPGTLASSEGSLRAAHHVRITADGTMLDRDVSLARFGRLHDLSLSHANRWCLQPGQLPELPISLTALVLDSGPVSAPLPTGLQLQHLAALRSLALYNHSCHWTREGQKVMLLPPHLQSIELHAPRVDLQQFLPSNSGPGPRDLTVVAPEVRVQFVDRRTALHHEFGYAAAGAAACSTVICAGVATLSLSTRQLLIENAPSEGATEAEELEFRARGGPENLTRLVASPFDFRRLSISPAAPGEQVLLTCTSAERLGEVVVGFPRVMIRNCKGSMQALARALAGPCWKFGLQLVADDQRVLISKP